jgi:cell division transport system permease protein
MNAEPFRLTAKNPLIPSDKETSLPLTLVMGVMCYLAAVTLIGALMIGRGASDWTQGLAGTATVQIMPSRGTDLEKQLESAKSLLEETPGIADARVMDPNETAELLKPWLGETDMLADLPMPRLIAVTFEAGSQPDLKALSDQLAEKIPGASLDDHGAWRSTLGQFAGTLGFFAYAVLVLIAAAATGTVIFATRAGLLAHQDIVEVLHLVGAKDRFIAGELERRFLYVGLEAGAAGTVIAMLSVVLAGEILSLTGSPGDDFYLPAVTLGVFDYMWLLLIPIGAALIAMYTARATVLNVLSRML